MRRTRRKPLLLAHQHLRHIIMCHFHFSPRRTAQNRPRPRAAGAGTCCSPSPPPPLLFCLRYLCHHSYLTYLTVPSSKVGSVGPGPSFLLTKTEILSRRYGLAGRLAAAAAACSNAENQNATPCKASHHKTTRKGRRSERRSHNTTRSNHDGRINSY